MNHQLLVYTGRLGKYVGQDALDITRSTAHNVGEVMGRDVPGAIFAPSWRIVNKMHREVEAADREKAYGRLQACDHMNQASWLSYAKAYVEEMRQSYRLYRAKWEAVLARDEVTLLCMCASPAMCHRSLAANILGKCGARVMGEREQNPDQMRLLGCA